MCQHIPHLGNGVKINIELLQVINPSANVLFDAKIAINVSDYPDKLNITFGEYGGRIGDVIYVGNNRSESYGKAYIVTGSKDIGGGIDDLEKFD